MANPYEEDCLTKMHRRISISDSVPVIAMFSTTKEHEIFGDQGGYPSIQEDSCFIHEGCRTIPETHGDSFLEQLYQLDGCFILEFEED